MLHIPTFNILTLDHKQIRKKALPEVAGDSFVCAHRGLPSKNSRASSQRFFMSGLSHRMLGISMTGLTRREPRSHLPVHCSHRCGDRVEVFWAFHPATHRANWAGTATFRSIFPHFAQMLASTGNSSQSSPAGKARKCIFVCHVEHFYIAFAAFHGNMYLHLKRSIVRCL